MDKVKIFIFILFLVIEIYSEDTGSGVQPPPASEEDDVKLVINRVRQGVIKEVRVNKELLQGLQNQGSLLERLLGEYRNEVTALHNQLTTEQREAKSMQQFSTKMSELFNLHLADECDEGSHKCSDNAMCTDTFSHYNCSCLLGYSGDGFTCEDVDECAEGTDDCGDDRTCVNSNGNYNCICHEGFQEEGDNCQDIDECESGVHKCHDSATCTNTIGNYTCKCLHDKDGDGYTCKVSSCESPSHVIPGLGCVMPVLDWFAWDDAKINCRAKGGWLLEGIKREHMLPLKKHFSEYLGYDDPWIGLQASTWVNSKHPVGAQNDFCLNGQPEESNQVELSCGYAYLSISSPCYAETDCSYSGYSLCQVL